MDDIPEAPEPMLRVTVADDPSGPQSLLDWLRHEDELRGRLRLESSSGGSGGEMGGLFDVLTVAVGSGGAGAVLARSLSTWLAHRHTDVKVTVKSSDGRCVEVDAHRVRDDLPGLMREIRRLVDAGEERE
ncbi:hypothetical protein [Streptomyces sp. NPDC096012]|uniref:effector-associated constant component EACC1 n=1 Tax=Streptomyces sp. NPDC096012 TaxID=3155684 RepID=UPI00336AB7EE